MRSVLGKTKHLSGRARGSAEHIYVADSRPRGPHTKESYWQGAIDTANAQGTGAPLQRRLHGQDNHEVLLGLRTGTARGAVGYTQAPSAFKDRPGWGIRPALQSRCIDPTSGQSRRGRVGAGMGRLCWLGAEKWGAPFRAEPEGMRAFVERFLHCQAHDAWRYRSLDSSGGSPHW